MVFSVVIHSLHHIRQLVEFQSKIQCRMYIHKRRKQIDEVIKEQEGYVSLQYSGSTYKKLSCDWWFVLPFRWIFSELHSETHKKIQGGSNMTGTDLCVNKPPTETLFPILLLEWVCGEFQGTGRFLQRGIWSQCVVPRSAVPSVRSSL